eukprot:m.66874 g.66874  ORF g.66874 m.66874 type:complete len:383 (-) comp14078_c0_seq1:142-1290(-)
MRMRRRPGQSVDDSEDSDAEDVRETNADVDAKTDADASSPSATAAAASTAATAGNTLTIKRKTGNDDDVKGIEVQITGKLAPTKKQTATRTPVILLMDVGMSKEDEPLLFELISRQRPVVLMEYAHGPDDTARSIRDLGADAVAVADHLNWPKFVLVGLGLGAMVALSVGQRWPGRVEKLCSLSCPDVKHPQWRRTVASLKAANEAKDCRALCKQLVASMLPEDFAAASPEHVKGIEDRFFAAKPMNARTCKTILGQLDQMSAFTEVNVAGWKKYPGPIFVIHGNADKMSPPDHMKELQAKLESRTWLLIVTGAGHLFWHSSNGREATSEMMHFLREDDSPHQRMAEGILGLWPVFAMIALAVLGYYAVLYDMEFELKSQAF